MGTTLAAIPLTDGVPQITAGVQILTASITPKSVTNKIRAHFSGVFSGDVGGRAVIVALFDGSANALKSRLVTVVAPGYLDNISFDVEHVPGVTTEKTYSVRFGRGQSDFTASVNGTTGGRFLGESIGCTLTLEEIAA